MEITVGYVDLGTLIGGYFNDYYNEDYVSDSDQEDTKRIRLERNGPDVDLDAIDDNMELE